MARTAHVAARHTNNVCYEWAGGPTESGALQSTLRRSIPVSFVFQRNLINGEGAGWLEIAKNFRRIH
jgi:hypothetical protein